MITCPRWQEVFQWVSLSLNDGALTTFECNLELFSTLPFTVGAIVEDFFLITGTDETNGTRLLPRALPKNLGYTMETTRAMLTIHHVVNLFEEQVRKPTRRRAAYMMYSTSGVSTVAGIKLPSFLDISRQKKPYASVATRNTTYTAPIHKPYRAIHIRPCTTCQKQDCTRHILQRAQVREGFPSDVKTVKV